VPVVSSLLAAIVTAIPSFTRVSRVRFVVFVVTAGSKPKDLVFAVGPAVGDFHEDVHGLGFQPAQLFDMPLSPDSLTEGVDGPISRYSGSCV
jgi:hypothetical protein